MRLSRAAPGWALAESLLALTLTAMIAVAALGHLVALQRRASGEAERVVMRAGLRTAAQVLQAELASVDPAAGDLLATAGDRLSYRAIRGTGIGCGLAVDGVAVRMATWRSLRLPAPGRDSVLLIEATGGWVTGPLTGPTRSATCPDGTPAMVLPTNALVPLGGVTVVRTFEVMELRAYFSAADGWLGLRSVSAGEAIQPVAGPFRLAPTTFEFLDLTGMPGATPGATRQVRARLTGVTRTDLAAGAAARADAARVDSLEIVVPLRGGSPP